MNSINHPVTNANYNRPAQAEKGPLNQKAESVLRIKKVALVALTILVGILALAAVVAVAATFTPYAAFAAGAFAAFKVLAAVTGIALGTFALSQAMDSIASKLPRPLAAVAHVIHAFITEFFALIAMSALYFVNLEKKNPKEIQGNDQQPILLIHGLYHNSSAWVEYKQRLKDAGVGPVFTINLGNPFGSIDSHAEKVKAMVANIQQVTGRKDIMLVGHSMGGVVASKFALDLADEDTKVTDIITIGSPLKGTALAKYIGIGKDVKQMRSDSDYIKDLSDRICKQSTIQFFHLASCMDELVPQKSALLSENIRAKHKLIPNLGHAGLLYSREVIDPIIDHYKQRQMEV